MPTETGQQAGVEDGTLPDRVQLGDGDTWITTASGGCAAAQVLQVVLDFTDANHHE